MDGLIGKVKPAVAKNFKSTVELEIIEKWEDLIKVDSDSNTSVTRSWGCGVGVLGLGCWVAWGLVQYLIAVGFYMVKEFQGWFGLVW